MSRGQPRERSKAERRDSDSAKLLQLHPRGQRERGARGQRQPAASHVFEAADDTVQVDTGGARFLGSSVKFRIAHHGPHGHDDAALEGELEVVPPGAMLGALPAFLTGAKESVLADIQLRMQHLAAQLHRRPFVTTGHCRIVRDRRRRLAVDLVLNAEFEATPQLGHVLRAGVPGEHRR